MSRNPFLNALLAAAYIGAVACVMFYGQRLVGPVDTILAPIAFLSLFVLSAAVMGFLFFYEPLKLFLDGDRSGATKLFLTTIAAFAVMTAIFLGALVIFSPKDVQTHVGETIQNGRVMSTDDYVKLHIGEISPVKETVGGKFYVTKIETHDGTGTVWYEDGHDAYVADFSYTAEENSGIKISSFTIRN